MIPGCRPNRIPRIRLPVQIEKVEQLLYEYEPPTSVSHSIPEFDIDFIRFHLLSRKPHTPQRVAHALVVAGILRNLCQLSSDVTDVEKIGKAGGIDVIEAALGVFAEALSGLLGNHSAPILSEACYEIRLIDP